MSGAPGPLGGIRVLEMEAMGGVPFAGMVLADMGADVVVLHRPGRGDSVASDPLARGKRAIEIDLRATAGRARFLEIVSRVDILMEGHRPGVMERLGVGPEACHEHNPTLVLARVSAWGQTGDRSGRAAYDLSILGLSGALHAMGERNRAPRQPLNLVADFAAGGLLVVGAVLAALHHAKEAGRGCVIDHSMVEGASLMLAQAYGRLGSGEWSSERESNLSDGAAPFYRAYMCADGGLITVAALSDTAYSSLLRMVGLPPRAPSARWEKGSWPDQSARFSEIFRSRTRSAWVDHELAEAANLYPALELGEVPTTVSALTRGSFYDFEDSLAPSPAPHFSGFAPRRPGRARQTAFEEVSASWSPDGSGNGKTDAVL